MWLDMSDEDFRFSIDISSELHHRLKIYCVKRKIPIKTVMAHIILRFLQEKEQPEN